MPTYQYECEKCGHTFEKFQRMTEPPVKRCPKCRCKVRRLIGTGAGIIFKGSGFYETDYKRKSNGKSEASESQDAGGKADAKPAEKSESKSTGKSASSEKSTAGKSD